MHNGDTPEQSKEPANQEGRDEYDLQESHKYGEGVEEAPGFVDEGAEEGSDAGEEQVDCEDEVGPAFGGCDEGLT